MFIRLYIVYFLISISQILASCPYIRTSIILAECVFDTSLYISLGAHIFNSNSIDFIGHYSLNTTENLYTNTLIYNLGNRWMLVLPLLVKCSQQPINLTFTECQYTMRQQKSSIKSAITSEYMTTQLSVINITNLGMQSVLFLQPGEIILRSCKAYDCSKELVYLTASNETFHFEINYEKTIDTKCQTDNDCNNNRKYSNNNLLQCDQYSQTCQCFDDNITTIDLNGIGRLCTDSIEQSNCTKFPQRCLHWCNESKTSHCICPKYTRKVRRINGIFDCELEPNGICRFDDDYHIGFNIRKCPTGTICDGSRCQPSTINRQMLQDFSNESLSISTTLKSDLISSTIQPHQQQQSTINLIRILIVIGITSLVFFILIIFIIAMLIKSNRFPLTTLPEDKVSSSSFAPSTSTAMSTEFYKDIYHFKPQSFMTNDYSKPYENYIPRSTFIPGLVPQTNLSPRFYRPYQGLPNRIPLHIESPSVSCVNQGLLTTNKRTHLPTITHLKNGDVLISA